MARHDKSNPALGNRETGAARSKNAAEKKTPRRVPRETVTDEAALPKASRGKVKWPVEKRSPRTLNLPDADAGGKEKAPSQETPPVRQRQESQDGSSVSAVPKQRQSRGKVTWPTEKQSRLRPLNLSGADAEKSPTTDNSSPVPRVESAVARAPQQQTRTDDTKAPIKSRQRSVAEETDAVPQSEPEAPPLPKPLWFRILQSILALAICAAAAGAFFLWQRHARDVAMPPMVVPQPYFYEEEQPVQAVLLWHEQVLYSPSAGTVQFANGGKTAVVAANDAVATILAKGRTVTVRSPSRGYFVPALDGAEGAWNYSDLWIGEGILPEAPTPVRIADLAPLGADRAVGKLITLPQNPRAIFYIDLTDRLSAGLARGTISIRRESRGPKWTASVRVYNQYGATRAKVALDMPGFPMDMTQSRRIDFLVCSDEDSGLIVPESAVALRSGSYGVYELVGDQIIFRKVTGKPVKDNMFFVSSGLTPGNPVMLDAANAEEKRVRLW